MHLEPGLIDAREDTHVKVNSPVFAGARIIDGKSKVRVERTGHQTRMAATHRWIHDASSRQNQATMLSTKMASWLIPVTIVVAVVDFVAWVALSNNYNAAMATALAFLVIGPDGAGDYHPQLQSGWVLNHRHATAL